MTTVVVLTAGTSWDRPIDCPDILTKVQLWAGGAGGATEPGSGGGGPGGGGEYVEKLNHDITGDSSVAYAIGSGGAADTNGGDTTFDTAGSQIVANGGNTGSGNSGGSGGTGGTGGTSTADGGDGGNSGTGLPNGAAGGGGGAGGPNGAGNNGSNATSGTSGGTGGSGDAGSGGAGGAGGGNGTPPGSDGADAADNGGGGGGGGGFGNGDAAGDGGFPGGGGGGDGDGGNPGGPGVGAAGKIIITYEEITGTIDQSGYQWRNDDGGEAAATDAEAEDTAHTFPKETNRRLRVQLNATDDPGAIQPQLEYKEAGDPDSEYRAVPVS